MNMDTIIQELSTKLKNMSIKDFYIFLWKLCKMWEKHHKKYKKNMELYLSYEDIEEEEDDW